MITDAVPVLDCHVHHWDHRNTPREPSTFVKFFGWNRSLMNALAVRVFPRSAVEFFGHPQGILANYLPEDFRDDASDWSVGGYVHVEAGWQGKGALGPVAETRWLESLDSPRLKAIVGFAELRLGDEVERTLDAHLAASERFRGVRYTLSHHANTRVLSGCDLPGLMSEPTWRRGFAKLADRGLSFEATVYSHQIDELARLAHDFPDVPVILSHAGTPTAYAGPFCGEGEEATERDARARRWRDSLERLAVYQNVAVKISGLAMPILGWGYHHTTSPAAEQVAHDIRPMVDALVDTFGPDRCMFGSNFPVDRVSMPWTSLYAAYARTVEHRPASERRALFRDTAARIYRLN